MPKNKHTNKEWSLTPAVWLLNIGAIAAIALLLFFAYKFVTDSANSEPIRTTPPLPETVAKLPLYTANTTMAFTEAEQTTESISMTKSVTTTPAPVTSATDTPSGEDAPLIYRRSYFSNSLFVGDSIMTGFYLYDYLDKSNVFAEKGLNPTTILDYDIGGQTLVAKTAEMKPERIFVMLGSNGIAFLPPASMGDSMEKLLDGLEKASPDSQIILMSIPPVTQAHNDTKPEKNAAIKEYNDILENVAVKHGVTFADIHALLQNAEGCLDEQYAEQDGLHFLGTAYKTVLSNLQTLTSEE
jgi:lysophospholipase L1-like esterase